MKFRAAALAAILGLVAVFIAACGETDVIVGQAGDGISVTGTGSVTVQPDVGVLSLGIEVRASTVARARSEAAEAMEAIRDSLEDNGIEEGDIQTQFFNIFPQQVFEEGEPPRIVGFVVNNQVEVKVRDIDTISAVLDDAIEAGGDAVRVNNISFTVDEPEQFLAEARGKAMEDAKERAEQLAELGGVELGNPRSISEAAGVPPIAFPERAFDGAVGVGGAPTPISPGEAEIIVNVFVVYEIR